MDNAFRMLSDLVSNLTSVIVGILGLGIVGSLAFGDMMGHKLSSLNSALIDQLTGWLVTQPSAALGLSHTLNTKPDTSTLNFVRTWLYFLFHRTHLLMMFIFADHDISDMFHETAIQVP